MNLQFTNFINFYKLYNYFRTLFSFIFQNCVMSVLIYIVSDSNLYVKPKRLACCCREWIIEITIMKPKTCDSLKHRN